LLALVAALTLLTAATAGSVVVADRALSDVDGQPARAHAAAAVADRLVAADSPLTQRDRVVTTVGAGNLTPAAVDRLAPAAQGRPVRVRLGNRTLVDRGTARGPTVRRVVRVVDGTVVRRVPLAGNRTVTVGPTPRVELTVQTRRATVVTTVRADGRVVLHAPGGLSGTATVRTSPAAETTLRVAASGTNGSVVVRSTPPVRTTTLRVTVGSRQSGGGGAAVPIVDGGDGR
jgi:hypothetical protein